MRKKAFKPLYGCISIARRETIQNESARPSLPAYQPCQCITIRGPMYDGVKQLTVFPAIGYSSRICRSQKAERISTTFSPTLRLFQRTLTILDMKSRCQIFLPTRQNESPRFSFPQLQFEIIKNRSVTKLNKYLLK